MIPGLGSNTYLHLNTAIWCICVGIANHKKHVFVFNMWTVFEKYLQIQTKYKNYQQKGKALQLAQESRQNVFTPGQQWADSTEKIGL